MPALAPVALPIIGAAGAWGAGKLLDKQFGGGRTQTTPQMPNDITGLRSNLISWLQSGGHTPNIGGMSPFGGVNQQGGFGVGPTFAGGSALPNGLPGGNAPALASTNTHRYTGGLQNEFLSPDQNPFQPSGTPAPTYNPNGGFNVAALAGRTGANGTQGTEGGFGGGLNNPGNDGAPVGIGSANAPSAFDQMFYHPTFAPPSTPFNPATITGVTLPDAPGLDRASIANVPGSNFQTQSTGPAANYNSFLDPGFQRILSMFTDNGGKGLTDGLYTPATGGTVGNVADVGSVLSLIQSLPEIVNGQQDYFKNNVMSAYQPLFDQQRELALAQAKESAGSLTGSGFANTLGNSVNRSVVEQGAKLSDILTQLAGMEQNKQIQGAGLEQGRNFQNQNTQLSAAETNAQLATQASMANASSSAGLAASRMSQLGNFANLFGSLAQDQAGRTDKTNQFNTGQYNQYGSAQAIANAQQATDRAIAQGQIDASQAGTYFNGILQHQRDQGNLTQDANTFNAGQYNGAGMFNTSQTNNMNQFNAGQANQAGQFNAQNYLNSLLGISNGGVTAGQPYYQPGASDAFAQILPYLTALYANRGRGNTTTPGPTGGQP